MISEQAKKHCRTNPGLQLRELSLTKQKIRPGTDLEWTGKSFSRNPSKEIKKKLSNLLYGPKVTRALVGMAFEDFPRDIFDEGTI